MKRSKAKRGRLLTRLRATVGRWLRPTSCLPCVGLVVLGGCLTLIMMPDPPAGAKPETAALAPDKSGLHVPKLPTIVVDPGHGGHDEGTKWHGISEKDMTLDVALRVERLLKLGGFPVLMTRRENVYITLEERARMANQLPDAVFVSIHFNSDPTGSSSGIGDLLCQAQGTAR